MNRINVGDYFLSIRTDNEGEPFLWICKEDGEGMGTAIGKFEAVIDEFWDANF